MYTDKTAQRWLYTIMGLALFSHVVSWFYLGPLQDEAYYWTWTKNLQLSYFDHPPMVGWLMWPFTTLFGDHLWSLRLSTVLGWFVAAYFIYLSARELYTQHSAGLYALLVWTSMPIVMGGFHIATPDTPLAAFTALTYYLALRAVGTGQRHYWLLTGLAAGLALLSKYTAILVPASIFIGLLLSPAGRRQLAGVGPWLAVLIMLLVFSPVIVWNAQHEWASFIFQFKHGVQKELVAPAWLLLAFFVGQLGMAMPWTYIAIVVASLRLPRHPQPATLQRHLLFSGFWLPMLVFGLAGATAESGPNWTLTAYIPASLILAGTLQRWLSRGSRARLWLVLGLYLLPLLLVNLLRFPAWMQSLNIQPQQRTQLTFSYGWDKVGEALQHQLHSLGERGQDCTVIAQHYPLAASIALILGDTRQVTTRPDARMNQFDYWRTEPLDVCLYIEHSERNPAEDKNRIALPSYGEWQRVQIVSLHNPDNSDRWYSFYRPVKELSGN